MHALSPIQSLFFVVCLYNCVAGCVYALRSDRRAGRAIAISAASGLMFFLTLTPVPRFLAAGALLLTIFGAILMTTARSGAYDINIGEDSTLSRRRH